MPILLKLFQKIAEEETEIMNNPVIGAEIEAVIKKKKNSSKQKPRTRWLHRRILSNI